MERSGPPPIYEILAAPHGGKTSIAELLVPKLEKEGISVFYAGNKDVGNDHLRAHLKQLKQWLRDVDYRIPNSRFQKAPECAESALMMRFLAFQQMLLWQNLQMRFTEKDIIVEEHGPNFVFGMEVYGSQIDSRLLGGAMKFVLAPRAVIYLFNTVEALRERGATELVRSRRLSFVVDGFEAMYSRRSHQDNWLRIETAGKSKEEIADICLPFVRRHYHEYVALPAETGLENVTDYYDFNAL